MKSGQSQKTCSVCGTAKRTSALVPGALVRPPLSEFITARHPGFDDAAYICRSCLAAERARYVVEQLEQERGELSALERDVSAKASLHSTIASRIDEQFDRNMTRGQALADSVARVGGSWPFVIGFGVALVAWIVLNSKLGREAFDPYPYILLNLLLSCLAAIQAPIIMMSQNRVSARDRLKADEDYRINLKAELEVAALHEKMDHMLHIQWERLVAIQQVQLQLLDQHNRRD